MPFVTAGSIKLVWQVAEQAGISREELLAVAGLDAEQLDDGATPISDEVMARLVLALYRRTQDPGLGLRVAEAFDFRTLGFWGYAILSCLTLRQGLQLVMHYQERFDLVGRVAFRVERDTAILEISTAAQPPPELLPLAPLGADFLIAVACRHYARCVGRPRPEAELWLSYPEQPHHQKLRELVTGPCVFDAASCQLRIPAQALEQRRLGDPYLLELARRELDKRLATLARVVNGDLHGQVRRQLSAALPGGASLTRIARDLQLSSRTLRRKLRAAGKSFQELFEEVRQERAISFLLKTDHSVKEIAARLGYSDPTNFRRAFVRWTGSTPGSYRAKHRPAPGD